MKEVRVDENGAIINLKKFDEGIDLIKFKMFKDGKPFDVTDNFFTDRRLEIKLTYHSGIGYILKKGEESNELLSSISLDFTKNVGTFRAEIQLIKRDSDDAEVFDGIKFVVKEESDELSDNTSN